MGGVPCGALRSSALAVGACLLKRATDTKAAACHLQSRGSGPLLGHVFAICLNGLAPQQLPGVGDSLFTAPGALLLHAIPSRGRSALQPSLSSGGCLSLRTLSSPYVPSVCLTFTFHGLAIPEASPGARWGVGALPPLPLPIPSQLPCVLWACCQVAVCPLEGPQKYRPASLDASARLICAPSEVSPGVCSWRELRVSAQPHLR